jgi:glycosyltransferase involved in cell wall biosynthesis
MQAAPFFSIVIPTYNRPRQLAACLGALARADYRQDCFEVIVVNDGGPPHDATIASFKDRLDLKLLDQPHAGPAAARNLGATQARGALLVFTDDDCLPSVTWLSALARRCADSDRAVGGRTLNALPDNPYSTASQLLIEYLYGYYNADRDRARFLTSNNVAFPTALFRRVGGFDAAWPHAAAEDRDLCDRWLQNGFGMTYETEGIVYHAHPLTLRSFLRQHFGYGLGAFWFHRLRAKRGQGPIEVEPLRFYCDLIKYPFVQRQGLRAPLLALLLAMTQLANATGYFWARRTLRAG